MRGHNLVRGKMYNSDFMEYLSDKTGVDFIIIDELSKRSTNIFDIATTLINLYGVDNKELGKIWGDYLGFAYVDPNSTIVKAEYIKKLGIDFIKTNKVIPLYKFGRAVTVSTADPNNPFMQDKLEKMLDEIVSLVFCFPFDVEDYLKKI